MQSLSCTRDDLKFFGAVSASISHELKNVLAIINELTGLMDDLSRAAATGRGLSPERLQHIADRMKNQITRGDDITRQLSRFAHSVDQEEETIDLGDMIRFVVHLAARSAAVREIEMDTALVDAPVSLTANAFIWEHLLWAVLKKAFSLCTPGSTLKIELTDGPQRPLIRFRALTPIQSITEDQSMIGVETITDLAQKVEAVFNEDDRAAEITIVPPPDR